MQLASSHAPVLERVGAVLLEMDVLASLDYVAAYLKTTTMAIDTTPRPKPEMS